MEALVGGDVLLKCLMAQDSSSSASSYCIFRETFHTGFLGRRTSRVLRFTVDQLDGASSECFGTDFCMDLEYYPNNYNDIVDDDLVHVKPVGEDNHGHDHLKEQKTDELLRQVLLPQAVGPLDPILYDPNSRLWEVLSNPNDLRTSVIGLRRKPNPDDSANGSDTDFDPGFIDGMKVPHHRYNHNDENDNDNNKREPEAGKEPHTDVPSVLLAKWTLSPSPTSTTQY